MDGEKGLTPPPIPQPVLIECRDLETLRRDPTTSIDLNRPGPFALITGFCLGVVAVVASPLLCIFGIVALESGPVTDYTYPQLIASVVLMPVGIYLILAASNASAGSDPPFRRHLTGARVRRVLRCDHHDLR